MIRSALVVFLVTFWSFPDQGVGAVSCPKVIVKPDLEVKRLTGTWYTYSIYGRQWIAGEGSCQNECWTYNETSNYFDVVWRQKPHKRLFIPTISVLRAKIYLSGHGTEGKFTVEFPVKGPFIKSLKAPLYVLDTDYDSYLILYSCVNLIIANPEKLWVLTREYNFKYPQCHLEKTTTEVIKNSGINIKWWELKYVDQSDCKGFESDNESH